MVDAIVSRGNTSVSVPLLADGGSLLVARDIGKPNATYKDVGREDARYQDFLNAQSSWTVAGILTGSNAYSDAKTLAESLIKPRATTGTPLQLDLSALPNRSTYDVAPASEESCVLTYVPGRRDMVGVQLSLTEVGTTVGGSQSSTANSSPDSGSGIKIERSGTSVTFDVDQTVTRSVGRPNGKLHPRPNTNPSWIDKNDPAVDVFEIQTSLVESNAESKSNTLETSITRDRLGTNTLTLHFLNNLFDLDAYTVAPKGGQSLRTAFSAGETGMVSVPTLKLRVVDNT